MRIVDPLRLAQDLIRCPSVTPKDAGALDVLQRVLEGLGFTCRRLPFTEAGTPDVDNLHARIGTSRPDFCFAGHTDVVPVGDASAWTRDPFAATVADDRLWGRGAADMKGAIAGFVAAASRYIASRETLPGSISLLITGDEEGPAVNGTVKVLRWLKERDELPDLCLVGEPTSASDLGETIKIGRRGSLNGVLTVFGTQGHSAYPERADNPISRLLRMLSLFEAEALDHGTPHFQPSTLVLTSVDVGNTATNVIPGRARAAFNIRYNDLQSPASLEAWLRKRCDHVGGRYDLAVASSGDAFLTPPGRLSEAIAGAVERMTGRKPRLDTGGGTSDARFIKEYCPVAEFGTVGATAHKVDENVAVDDLYRLADIYVEVLGRCLESG